MKLATLLAAAVLALSACGPIESSVVIRDASVQLEAARVSDAERYAQFEYRAAAECLHKAKQEQSYSEYKAAIELAQAAHAYAEKARARALGHPDRGPASSDQPPRPKVIAEPGDGLDL